MLKQVQHDSFSWSSFAGKTCESMLDKEMDSQIEVGE